jgi:RNA polymerase sigma factor (sigma-70 family)
MDTTKTTTALISEVTPTIRGLAARLIRTAGGSVETQDLVQVGLMAAFRCAQTFDASAGAAFRTYCWHPVAEEMKRALARSRSSVQRSTGRCIAKDVSFSAPISAQTESDDTVGDTFADSASSAEELVERAERESKVRAIVARVRADWKNKALFDDLLNRLMVSHFAGEGERLRAEVPLAIVAEKHGISRQGVHQTEKKIREALSVALAGVEA